MSSDDLRACYDPEQALALAGGRSDLRDLALIQMLDLLDDPRAGGLLCDVERYGLERAACYEVAHRACGLARQAAMPALARLFRALTDALDAADLTQAEQLGRTLPATIDAAEQALISAGSTRCVPS